MRVEATRIDMGPPSVRDFVPKHVAATGVSAGWSAAAPERREEALLQIERQTERFRSGDGIRAPFWSYFVTAAHSDRPPVPRADDGRAMRSVALITARP